MTKLKKFLQDLFVLRNVPSILILVFIGMGVFNPALLKMDTVTVILAAIGALAVENIIERLTYLSRIREDVDETSKIVSDIKKAVENVEVEVITDDAQISDVILKLANRVKIREAQILSSGFTTRKIMVTQLLQKGIRVQALLQDPETALDKRDQNRVREAMEWVEHHRGFIQSGLFDARYHYNISTIRAIVVHEDVSDVKHVFLSWYYYQKKNTMVYGDPNPTIYCTTQSKQGAKLYEWLCRIIEKDLKESRKITLRDYRNR